MKYTIHVGEYPITLEHGNLDRNIDVDDLTIIDTSNIFGEHTTISAAVNRIGLLKAEVEAQMALSKMEYKLYEGTFKNNLRKEAANNNGKYKIRVTNEDVEVKLTEAALSTSFEIDPEWIKLKQSFIQSEKNFNQLDVLYWSCQDKSRKLNGLVNGTTPDDYIKGMIAGKVNGILIKKG
tara:strand:- start:26055 stop:26591 length:537 start_codon:yes stop_codon:yes gene_type:complete